MHGSKLAILIALAAISIPGCGETSPAPAIDAEQITYGPAASEFGLFSMPSVPANTTSAAPVVVLVHGGFWRRQFGADLMEPLAHDLVRRGYAVWNVEYGRVGEAAGGWPHTFEHVAAAIDHLVELADVHPIDLERVAVVGHSAGGHLAAWAGGRDRLDADQPGADPAVVPRIVVGQGAVIDLDAAARDGLGNGAVTALLGGDPAAVPDRYQIARPRNGRAKAVMVNGALDRIVPPTYSAAAGYRSATLTIDGADHFAHIDPASTAWAQVVGLLDRELA